MKLVLYEKNGIRHEIRRFHVDENQISFSNHGESFTAQKFLIELYWEPGTEKMKKIDAHSNITIKLNPAPKELPNLLNCPFCGAKPELKPEALAIICSACDTRMDENDRSLEELVAKWNKRS